MIGENEIIKIKRCKKMNENKFRDKRKPKEPVRIEMNDPDAVNPELERRKQLTDKAFLEEMLEQIKVRKKQILESIKMLRDKTVIQAQIKQNQDMLKILNIDLEKTKSLYQKEVKREGRKR